MSSLSALWRNSPEKSPGDEKLMDLYWNRNELKKEFADLRNEKYRLQDKIKERDGVIARLQQKLDHLEDLLVDPEWSRNALVCYQLRGIGLRCQRKLSRFAEQLKQQREQKQQNHVMSNWKKGVALEVQGLESQIATHRDAVIQLEDRLQAENRLLDEMSGFLRLIRRRSICAGIDELNRQIQVREREQDALRHQIEEVNSRQPPDNVGLDIATKRSINFMILAFAQQLYLLFEDDELASFVKEAGEKSAGAIRYGDDQDCEAILRRIRRSAAAMERSGDFADALQRRAKLIGERAVFQNDGDAVPAAGTVATLYRIDANGIVTEGDVNILGDNYWGVAGFLSR